jgi:tRNA (uracil-5-)-methyltransferase
MIQEVQKSMGKPVIAVVDPARDGLHPEVVRAIRNSSVQRLIYVSCNPTGSLIKDCSMLCSPPTTKYRGLPFKPTSAQPGKGEAYLIFSDRKILANMSFCL